MFPSHFYTENLFFPEPIQEKNSSSIEEKISSLEKSEDCKKEQKKEEEEEGKKKIEQKIAEKNFLGKLMKKIDKKLQSKRKIEESNFDQVDESFLPEKKKPKIIKNQKIKTQEISKGKKKLLIDTKQNTKQLSKKALSKFNAEFLPSALSKSQNRLRKLKDQQK